MNIVLAAINAKYIHSGNSADYAIEQRGRRLYVFFEWSNGCPDWKNNRIFVSHMGEVNLALAARKPLLQETPYKFSNTGNLIKAGSCLKAGKAVLSNLAPGPDGKFILTCARVEMTAPDTPSNASITGWFIPQSGSIHDFLAEYSMKGGTHHLLISYGTDLCAMKTFAHFMQWEFRVIC